MYVPLHFRPYGYAPALQHREAEPLKQPSMYFHFRRRTPILHVLTCYWSFIRKTILDDRPETDVLLVAEIHGKSVEFNEIHRFTRLNQLNQHEICGF